MSIMTTSLLRSSTELMAVGFSPPASIGMHSWFQPRVAAQFRQHVLGQDVFKGVLRHGRAFATQPISDKSLASGSYELRHTRTRLFKRSTTAQMRPSTVTKVAANSILSELVLY